jgi:Na+/H+-dicarboxylate symporter
MKLWQKVTLGLVMGIFFGIYAPPEYAKMLKPVGDVFLSLVKMVIMPLIFFSLISGMTNISDPDALGRIGMKATLAFVSTTMFAALFGVGVALTLKPGIGTIIDLGAVNTATEPTHFEIVPFLINIIPSNPVDAFAKGNVLQVVFFALFLGVTINKLGPNTHELRAVIHSSAKLFIKMISYVIELAPYAAFVLIAWVVSTQGVDVLFSLSKLVLSVIIAMILQYFIFGLMILVFCRMSPMPFYKKSWEYQVIALSSASSKATLPTTMEVCNQRLGVSESSTSFLLPLGAALNMNGFAINLSLTTIFFAQMLGVSLEPHDYLIIVLTSTLGSIGGAGIPGASLIMLPMVLAAVNLPIEGVAILAGIDRVLDMLRTAINITGDATITLIVDNSEGTLDREKYLAD